MSETPSQNHPEALRYSEEDILALARTWGDRLIAAGTDPALSPLFEKFGTRKAYAYALATHHAKTDREKSGIAELGGVIGVPDAEQILFYGKDAAEQVLLAFGARKGYPYSGVVRDGLTHIYLAPIPAELYEEAGVYFRKPSPFGDMFLGVSRDKDNARFQIERTLQAPWERLPVTLTEKPDLLRERLKGGVFDLVNKTSDEFVYRLRILENRHLLTII